MSRFNFTNTSIRGVKLVGRRRLRDKRGFFERVFCDREMDSVLGSRSVVQITALLRPGGAPLEDCIFSIRQMQR